VIDIFPDRSIVYLSPDASETLTDLSVDTVYVIGGIVDKVVERHQSRIRAQTLDAELRDAAAATVASEADAAALGRERRVRCARLPLDDFSYRAQVLNVDTVIMLLAHFWQAPGDGWGSAMRKALPARRLAAHDAAPAAEAVVADE
jgi:hypothetical protein